MKASDLALTRLLKVVLSDLFNLNYTFLGEDDMNISSIFYFPL